MNTGKHRTTCWALTGVIRLTWVVAGLATMVDGAGLWLDGWANRTAARCGIDMTDVLAALNEGLPVAGEA